MHDPTTSRRGSLDLPAEQHAIRRRRRHRPQAKPLLLVSIGTAALGIGCICVALLNIRAGSVQPVLAPHTYQWVSSSPTTITPKPAVPKGETVAEKKAGGPSSQTSSLLGVRFAKNPSEGDTLGSLWIPALGQTMPIIEGTGTSDLEKGVGHYRQSVLPGAKDNCVLSGHRDTVFSRLGEVKIGDRAVLQTLSGTFTYEIKRIRIVHQDDKTVIVPTSHSVLTLTTCYPFHFIGSAPDRYVVVGDLVKRQ